MKILGAAITSDCTLHMAPHAEVQTESESAEVEMQICDLCKYFLWLGGLFQSVCSHSEWVIHHNYHFLLCPQRGAGEVSSGMSVGGTWSPDTASTLNSPQRWGLWPPHQSERTAESFTLGLWTWLTRAIRHSNLQTVFSFTSQTKTTAKHMKCRCDWLSYLLVSLTVNYPR